VIDVSDDGDVANFIGGHGQFSGEGGREGSSVCEIGNR
jgi:hypothetical protein